jgi:hypothetical protein
MEANGRTRAIGSNTKRDTVVKVVGQNNLCSSLLTAIRIRRVIPK